MLYFLEPIQKDETFIKRPGAFSYNLLHIILLLKNGHKRLTVVLKASLLI